MKNEIDPQIEAAIISSVLHIRCAKHYTIPQQNKNEHSGGECGGCIAEEREFYKTQYEAYKVVIDSALDKLEKITGLTNAGLDGHILHIVQERDQLRLQVVKLREALEFIGGKTDHNHCDEPCPICLVVDTALAESPPQAAKEVLGPVIGLLEEIAEYDSGEQQCIASEAKQQIERLKGLM